MSATYILYVLSVSYMSLLRTDYTNLQLHVLFLGTLPPHSHTGQPQQPCTYHLTVDAHFCCAAQSVHVLCFIPTGTFWCDDACVWPFLSM